MTQRPLMTSLAVAGYAIAVGITAFSAVPTSAYAQTLGGCNPATGLGPNGQPCVELTPLDPNRASNVSLSADGSQYGTLDTTTLGQTYACRQLDASGQGSSGGTLLFEDCGTPLTGAELGELKPFYGTTGAPAPAPVVAAPAPAPAQVVYTPPPAAPVVVAAAPVAVAPPAFASVAVASSGLGGAGLIAAGVGAAAVIGIAAVALSDDDDDNNTVSTVSTQ